MMNLIKEKRILFELVPSYLETEFICNVMDCYDTEVYLIHHYGEYQQTKVPSLETLYENGDLEESFHEVFCASYFGDKDYYKLMLHDYEFIEYNEMRYEQIGEFMCDVEKVMKHYNLSFHVYNQIINVPFKEVW